MSLDIPSRLAAWAADRPDRVFLWIDDERRTYSQVDDGATRVANGLVARGITASDRVAIVCPTRVEVVESLFGVARMGAVTVPLNIFLKGETLRYQLADCSASAVIVDQQGLEVLLPLIDELDHLRLVVTVGEIVGGAVDSHVEIVPFHELVGGSSTTTTYPERASTDPCLIVYTSGTTGFPKGCVVSHRYMAHWGEAYGEFMDRSDDDVFFTAGPLFHASGLIPTSAALDGGVTVVLEPEFRASRWISRAIEVGATLVSGVGFLALALLGRPESELDRAHRLRRVNLAPLGVDEQAEFLRRFGVAPDTQIFSQTECFPISAAKMTDPGAAGTNGRPMPWLEVEIHDDDDVAVGVGKVGEIVVRPRRPGVMFDCYWGDPLKTLATFANLWHHTGDLGRLDERGYLSYVGRKKDSMRRRGENVSAYELENILVRHPAIAEIAVHALSLDDEVDDSIKACIVLEPGASLSPEELAIFFEAQLPYFAVPRFVQFVDALPRNASGRVMKEHLLREHELSLDTIDLEELGLGIAKSKRRGVAELAG